MKNFFVMLFLLGSVAAFAQEDDKPNANLKRKVVKQSSGATEPAKKRTRSKIINDSVKNVYGPKTTKWIYEKDLFESKTKNYRTLDTTIHNYHRWMTVQKYNNTYQDLGIQGTAMNPIFPLISTTIGANPGYRSYDPYYETAEPRYYDTKSPFSRMKIIWGGGGRAMTHVEFTRNINPRWNFGFNYRPILIEKQIQGKGNNDRLIQSQYYDIYTSFKSKNEKYFMILNYRRLRHQAKEYGGVKLLKGTAIDSAYITYFDTNSATPYLPSSSSSSSSDGLTTEDFRNSFHLFHQYQLAKPAQLYQIMDWSSQVNILHGIKDTNTDAYFNYTTNGYISTNDPSKSFYDANTFKVFQNEFGFKGNAAFLFYAFYYKIRSYSNTMNNLSGVFPNSSGIENYVGGKIALRFDSLSELSGHAELLLDGHYKLEGSLRTPWLDADLKSVLAKPGFMQQAYRGAFNTWLYDFNNTFSNQLSGFIKLNAGPLFFSPGVTYSALTNYIFFKQNDLQMALPYQSTGNQQLISPEVRLGIRFFKHFNFRPQVIYSKLTSNDDNAISLPTWFSNVQLSYDNTIFKGALQLQIGIDANYKSSYYALGYAPSLQQFYIQDKVASPDYWSTDVFLNGKIKRGRFFVKYINLVQAFTKQGYMPTPYYPNARPALDFGFELILFD